MSQSADPSARRDAAASGCAVRTGTFEQLRELVSTQLGVAPEEIVPEARILDDLGADSLDVVELVMALEAAFDITVPDDDVEGLVTIADVAVYVDKRLR